MSDAGNNGGGVDIDLYADVEDFGNTSLTHEDDDEDDDPMGGGSGRGTARQDSQSGQDAAGDLYDDVLASSGSEIKRESARSSEDGREGSVPSTPTQGSGGLGGGHSRRYQMYVGNLTWWTTDQDISDAVQSVGIGDFIEVKFHENRANGQSKGFCCVTLGSETSMKVLMEKLPKKELHGQNPVVTYATKQALIQFESQSKTRPPAQPPASAPLRGSHPPMTGSLGRPPLGRGMLRGPPPPFSRPPPGVGRPMLARPPPLGGPPPLMANPPPIIPRVPPPGIPPAPHVNPAFFPHGAPPASTSYGVPPGHALSEIEFEEIMGRNRTVSSSAIARAVQDAAAGEYASAIETLVTAISLIKQSKVAHDDRCRILISSLQDTLHGIENKSYGARRERSRSRDRERHRPARRRSYSREREREREYRPSREYYHHHRERSRSRDRDPHHRPPREDRYYDDRYKEREYRERDRESSRSRREEMDRDHMDREKDRPPRH